MSLSPWAINSRKDGVSARRLRRSSETSAPNRPIPAPVPFARDVGREQDVGHLGLEAELVARIGRVGAPIGAHDAVEQRIGAPARHLVGVGIVDRKGRVIMADDLVRAGVEILDIVVADEAARFFDHVLRQSGHVRRPSHRRRGRLRPAAARRPAWRDIRSGRSAPLAPSFSLLKYPCARARPPPAKAIAGPPPRRGGCRRTGTLRATGTASRCRKR